MKILIQPEPSPYKEVDPAEVVVDRLSRSIFSGRLEAWGYLRSEMETTSWHTADDFRVGPTERYRIAYENDAGCWCSEGVTRYEPLPQSVLDQIHDLQLRLSS